MTPSLLWKIRAEVFDCDSFTRRYALENGSAQELAWLAAGARRDLLDAAVARGAGWALVCGVLVSLGGK